MNLKKNILHIKEKPSVSKLGTNKETLNDSIDKNKNYNNGN
jgi:hypothetical protein